MDNINNQLKFDLSEKLFEGMCSINSHRIKVLNYTFIKLCENFPKIKDIFKEELEILHKLDQKENEYRHSLDVLTEKIE